MDKNKCITVILPTLNEVQALPKVIQELRDAGYHKIVVVDGGSTDGTVEKAKELGVQVVIQIGRGKGMALRTALMYVETPYVAVLDADYSYPPSELDKLIPYLRHHDIVLGKREGPMPLIYRIGNKAIAWLFRLIFNTDLQDPLTGMYVAKTHALREAALEARHFDIEVDLLAKALYNGAKVTEIPITYRKRLGKKKLKPLHGLYITAKLLSLAYRLNPVFSLFIAGSLLIVPGVILGGWVAYRYFYQGVPHYLLGLLALLLLTIGSISLALLPIATSLMGLRAAIMKLITRTDEVDPQCVPPPPAVPPPYTPREDAERNSTLRHMASGLAISFAALLVSAGLYAAAGINELANSLAKWAYYALVGAAGLLLLHEALNRRK